MAVCDQSEYGGWALGPAGWRSLADGSSPYSGSGQFLARGSEVMQKNGSRALLCLVTHRQLNFTILTTPRVYEYLFRQIVS
jgi:hypothetical protein